MSTMLLGFLIFWLFRLMAERREVSGHSRWEELAESPQLDVGHGGGVSGVGRGGGVVAPGGPAWDAVVTQLRAGEAGLLCQTIAGARSGDEAAFWGRESARLPMWLLTEVLGEHPLTPAVWVAVAEAITNCVAYPDTRLDALANGPDGGIEDTKRAAIDEGFSAVGNALHQLPNYSAAQLQLGHLYLLNGEAERAFSIVAGVIERGPPPVVPLVNFIINQARLGGTPSALDLAHRAGRFGGRYAMFEMLAVLLTIGPLSPEARASSGQRLSAQHLPTLRTAYSLYPAEAPRVVTDVYDWTIIYTAFWLCGDPTSHYASSKLNGRMVPDIHGYVVLS